MPSSQMQIHGVIEFIVFSAKTGIHIQHNLFRRNTIALSMKVCVGGTFDVLHKGHKTLIDKALELAGDNGLVLIGVATGALIKNKSTVTSESKRIQAIKDHITAKGAKQQVMIQPIVDIYGPLLTDDFDILIVSPETVPTAEEINKKRKALGKQPLKIVQIPFVLAADDQPISSSRIKKGEIDSEGNVLS